MVEMRVPCVPRRLIPFREDTLLSFQTSSMDFLAEKESLGLLLMVVKSVAGKRMWSVCSRCCSYYWPHDSQGEREKMGKKSK